MFKLLFGKKNAVSVENQRQTLTRALGEVNEIIKGLDEKPKICFDLATGEMTMELPDQMPDEAKALPAPEHVSEVRTDAAA